MRLLNLRVRAFKIIWGVFKRRDFYFFLGTFKLINSLHVTTHLVKKALRILLESSFRVTGLQMTIRQWSPLVPHVIKQPSRSSLIPAGPAHPMVWSYPGEDWQMNFTQMPVSQVYKYLLTMIDTFIWWSEVFPTWTEKVEEGQTHTHTHTHKKKKKKQKKTAQWNPFNLWSAQVITK